MRCPYCGESDTKVIDSRATEDDLVIKRRRHCENCSERFNTYERIDMLPFIVVKRDGTRETFERNKILNGIMLSCNKRPVSLSQMEEIVEDVLQYITNCSSKELESKIIGEVVMNKLKTIDEVAYVRFASVYKQFKDIDTFLAELSSIKNERESIDK